MKKLPLLLLLSALVLAPMHVSAMMEEEKKSEGSEKKETKEYSESQEDGALINNVGASHDSSVSVREVLLESKSSEPSQERTPVSPGDSDAGDNSENENLLNLTTL